MKFVAFSSHGLIISKNNKNIDCILKYKDSGLHSNHLEQKITGWSTISTSELQRTNPYLYSKALQYINHNTLELIIINKKGQ